MGPLNYRIALPQGLWMPERYESNLTSWVARSFIPKIVGVERIYHVISLVSRPG